MTVQEQCRGCRSRGMKRDDEEEPSGHLRVHTRSHGR